MDTDQIVRMKSELNSELACEQTFTPSAPSLYPTLSVLDNLPDKPRKAIEQTKYSWEMIYLAAFTVWAALGVFVVMFWHLTSGEHLHVLSWPVVEFDFRRIIFLTSYTLGVSIASIILLDFLRLFSKLIAYAFAILLPLKAIFLTFMTLVLLLEMLNKEKLYEPQSNRIGSLSIVVLLCAFLTSIIIGLIIMSRDLQKKDIIVISTLIKDTSKVIFFFPCAVLIMILAMLLLVAVVAYGALIFLTLWHNPMSPLTIGLNSINICVFLWTFFLILDSAYLALIIAFTTWKLSEDKNALKTLDVFSKVLQNLRHSFGNLAYGSSFLSIFKQLYIVWNSPFHLLTYICGTCLILSGNFNIGAYTMCALKKKSYETSVKNFANNILFKSPVKCVTYSIMGMYYALPFLGATLLILFFAEYLCIAGDSSGSNPEPYYGTIFEHRFPEMIEFIALFLIAIIARIMYIAFYIMSICHLSVEMTDVELIKIDVN